MNRRRQWLWLALSAPLMTVLLSACRGDDISGPRATPKVSLSNEVQAVTTFNGFYTHKSTQPGGYTHFDAATVWGTNVRDAHVFSNGIQAGIWEWSGTITVDAFDPNQGSISGAGKRSDRCCGSIEFTVTGNIVRRADGSATIYYQAVDPRFGPFGDAVDRRR